MNYNFTENLFFAGMTIKKCYNTVINKLKSSEKCQLKIKA